jgi:uracil-DNA glycosylase family 4
MISGVDSLPSMNREIRARLLAANLKVDCGAAGRFDSTVAIVGDAPGDRDTRVNQPFIGNNGVVLFDALKKQGLTRNHVYMTNAVKRQVLSASQAKLREDKKPVISKQEFEHYRLVLLDELSLLPNCKYVLALGPYALKALIGEDKITHWRGSVIPIQYAGRTWHVVCSYNPAAVVNDPKLEIIFRMDLDKLRRLMAGTFAPDSIDALINPSYEEALNYLEGAINDTTPFSYDIETMGNETACFGIARTENQGMCINFRAQGANRYTTREEIVLRRTIQRLFDTEKGTRSVAQNANFDNYWLSYKDRIHVKQTWFDTMLAHHVLYPSLPHSLGFLTSQYTDNPYYKDEGKLWKEDGDIDDFWRYNVKDCCYTLQAQRKILGELEKEKMADFFFGHVMKLQPHLTRMTVGGVLCDADLKAKFTGELEETLLTAKQLCQTTAQAAVGRDDYTFNPRSPRDLSTLFFTDLRLVGRGSSSDKENRDRMFRHPRTGEAARGVITAVNEYLRDAKFHSTYATATIDDDGRFRCEYKQTGVINAPGRLSSSSVMWGSGLNLQNIPERAKPMFLCDPGYEFSYFDAAQIEARFVACFANIKQWLVDFERARLNPGSFDAHCALASVMFNIPYDQVPTSDFVTDPITGLVKHTVRFVAKRCRHGLNYRMGPDRLAATTKMSLADAETNYRIYHQTNPEIKEWWSREIAEAKAKRQLMSPLGRRWLMLEKWDEDALDSIIAFKPQSTAGDHIASVIYKCERDPRWPKDARMVLNIHDANIAINRVEDGPLVRALMRSYAEEPLEISQPDEQGIHRWSTIKKLKERPELLTIPQSFRLAA